MKKSSNNHEPNQHFYLFPCCKLVFGEKNSLIYDFQREKFYPIPNSLHSILLEIKKTPTTLNDLYNKYQDKETIDSYFSFLIKNDLGRWYKDSSNFLEISDDSRTPEKVTHLVIFSNKISAPGLTEISASIKKLICKHLEIIVTDSEYILDIMDLIEMLKYFNESTLRSIDILIPYQANLSLQDDRIKKIILAHPLLNRINYYDINKRSDGKKQLWLNKDYFFNNLNSKNIFYKQLFIFENGDVKSNPFIEESFGNLHHTSLEKIVDQQQELLLWNIQDDYFEDQTRSIEIHNYHVKDLIYLASGK